MNKVTEYLYENRKQKGDGGNCLPVVSATMRSTTDTDKIIREESELKDQMSAFYNSITSSQPKELASDTYILPNFSENQCKSNKNQYKNISNMSNECNKHNSVTTDKCVKMSDRDDIDGSYASDSDSTDSDFSNFSGLSDLSGQEWKPITKTLTWVNKQMNSGVNPRDLLSHYLSNGVQIAPNLNDMSLWRLLANMLTEPPRRQKLRHINTIDDVVKLLNESNNIIVLTGAGVSVSCGIPDFRSSDGIYSRLAKDFPDLPDPQAMFDINYFSRDPRPFYKFAREIYPGQFVPSPCHKFIKLLEKKQKLLRNYTQNIDTLEQVAGIQNVIECHGSFATASCTKCRYKATADAIRDDIFSQRIPLCPRCHRNDNMFSEESSLSSASMEPLSYSDLVQSGIMKPDIVFFGEGLPDAFHSAMASDKDKCDLLIVIGSSLKVRPVALIPSSIPSNVPQILINREHLNHLEFDVELLGDSDIIINQLCHLLGEDWKEVCWDANILTECRHLKTNSSTSDDVLVATIDTDSQSTKSAITTNSSNGVFCDSGFESSSSLHAAQIMDGEKTFDQDQPQPADEQEQIQVRLSCEATTTNCFVTDNTISCTDETPVIDFTDERPVMDLTTEDGRNQTENLDRLQENLSLRHIAIDNSLTESSDLVPVSDCRIDPVEHRVNVEDDDGDVNDEDDDSDVDVDDPNGLKGGKISFSSPSPSYCSINKQISVAKRLQENTYYYNPSTSSYVFPGAQVYWSSDSEYDDDGDEDYIDEEEECDLKVDDTNPSGKSVVKRKHEINQNNDSDNDSPPNKRRKRTPVTEI